VSDPQIESLATRVAGMAGAFHISATSARVRHEAAAGGGQRRYLPNLQGVTATGPSAAAGTTPSSRLIEWYRLGYDDAALMTEVEALVGCLFGPPSTRTRGAA